MKISEIKNKTIVIDSNIPILYASKGFKERSGNILRVFKENKNSIVISEISIFELLNTDPEDKRVKYFIDFINYIQKAPVTDIPIMNAVLLTNEYKRLGCKHKIPLPDLMIGGTVIGIKDSLLLTTDREDFCEPIWNTVAAHVILKDNKKDVDATIYLLEFNNDISLPAYNK